MRRVVSVLTVAFLCSSAGLLHAPGVELLECVVQRRLIDDSSPRSVHDHRRRLAARKLLGVEEAGGLGRLGQVDGDEVRGGHQLFQRHETGAQDQFVVSRQTRPLIIDKAHAKRVRSRGNLAADFAKPDDH